MIEQDLPPFLIQGEPARLFPVLSLTSKEGRATSILLAVMQHVPVLAQVMFKPFNQRLGQRSRLSCFTEVVFKLKDCTKQAANVELAMTRNLPQYLTPS